MYRKIEHITIPISNDSKNIQDSWLVSKSTDVPSTNAKSLIPLLDVWGGGLGKGTAGEAE